ncbi:hypothetical protein [Lentzea jiangxiensis]|uniref:Ig-like domain-containing protein n=1 Tax=Lentzea jiangxiensis TaxID=641025 RepID=A0A1H0X4K8_9PSEU|nr:hypothetical protein [Lentzea jiangxiensis]SDP97884.1 hypothetical protein SAMN05421507_13432 [Lentzea jiangxiensis]
MALRQRFTPVALLGAVLMATACTGSGNDRDPADAGETRQDGEYQVNAGVPEQYRAKALADGKHRAIDACGLHDPDAAQKATGDRGDEILPSTSGLQECTLRLHQGEFKSTWTLYLEVGTAYDAGSRKNDAPEQLGGMDVFVSEGEDGKRCEISKPLDDKHAVQVRASASNDTPAKPACQVLREYVTALAPVWKNMPKHGGGRTAPELTLVKLDPCAAAAATLDMFEEGFLKTSGPMACTARSAKVMPPQQKPAKGVGQPEVSVTWIMASDPAKLIRPGDNNTAREITVEGRKAVLSPGSYGCSTYVVWDDQIKVDQDNRAADDDLTQQMRIQTATCDTAEEVTKKILARVGRR